MIVNIRSFEIESRLKQISEIIEGVNVIDGSFLNDYLIETALPIIKNQLEKKYIEHKNKKDLIPFYDLFAGAGGLSLGLETEGFEPKLVLDNYKAANQTYLFNRPFLNPDKIISESIREIDLPSLEFAPLVVGGPPCQGFSHANKQRKEDDERNELYKFFLKSVESIKPPIFLMENVEGILPYKEVIQKDFAEINYSSKVFKLNTNDFGFPQQRKRVFFLGISDKISLIHDELFNIFSTIQNEFLDSYNLFDAIGDLPVLDAKTQRNSTWIESKNWGYTIGPVHKNKSKYCSLINDESILEFPLLNHRSKFNNDRDIEIYSLLKQGEKSDAKAIEKINPYLSRKDIFKDKFCKLNYLEPSKTITAHMYYDCHMYIHPTQSRGLTPREAARIQGFPDDYFFLGSPNEWYRQIGNAVSPILAKQIGKKLNLILSRIYRN
jgi:DNA (cytosine-5)-methyltransferase 1